MAGNGGYRRSGNFHGLPATPAVRSRGPLGRDYSVQQDAARRHRPADSPGPVPPAQRGR